MDIINAFGPNHATHTHKTMEPPDRRKAYLESSFVKRSVNKCYTKVKNENVYAPFTNLPLNDFNVYLKHCL